MTTWSDLLKAPFWFQASSQRLLSYWTSLINMYCKMCILWVVTFLALALVPSYWEPHYWVIWRQIIYLQDEAQKTNHRISDLKKGVHTGLISAGICYLSSSILSVIRFLLWIKMKKVIIHIGVVLLFSCWIFELVNCSIEYD